MKIDCIELSWFRGAGERGVLETDLKNVVIYGANGSGKSSFVDALEYIITNGRIRHLAHEYSRRKQEKGIINTHIPDQASASIKVSFPDQFNVQATINKYGDCSFSCNPQELLSVIQSWQLERLVLRQDEVADFINSTKGEKYSALIPLVGLEDYEMAAQNTNTLIRYIKDEGDITGKKGLVEYIQGEITKYFPDPTEEKIYEKLKGITDDYEIKEIPQYLCELINLLNSAILIKRDLLDPEVKRHSVISSIDKEDLPNKLKALCTLKDDIYGKIDQLLDARIKVLQDSSGYLDVIDITLEVIQCPACGQQIRKDDFSKHVKAELEELSGLIIARENALEAERQFSDAIDRVWINIEDESIANWLKDKDQILLKQAFDSIKLSRDKALKGQFTLEAIANFKTNIPLIDKQVKQILKKIPPSTKKIVEDTGLLEAANKFINVANLKRELEALNIVIAALELCESSIREYIRARTKTVISGISNDVCHLWSRLHPREPIEDIQLYQPEDEKSIDISLKYFGVNQLSPRLTLSEGHRNSLGLCIFWALVRQSNNKGCIFLDDIVSSLDREHRANVKDILLEDLKDYQVLLFTHDREWFYELSYFLPSEDWKFIAFKPWVDPVQGVQLSRLDRTFDDARSYINQNCELAGNYARQIMDTQLPIIAERLQIELPYFRGDKNDKRSYTEFLDKIIAESHRRLKRKVNNSWENYDEPIAHWEEAKKYLIAWANRGSHGGIVTPNEAEKLITACEEALDQFKCRECDKNIGIAISDSKKIVQCQCGSLRWHYG